MKGAVTGRAAVLWGPTADPSEGICLSGVQTCCSQEAETRRKSREPGREALKSCELLHFSFITADIHAF